MTETVEDQGTVVEKKKRGRVARPTHPNCVEGAQLSELPPDFDFENTAFPKEEVFDCASSFLSASAARYEFKAQSQRKQAAYLESLGGPEQQQAVAQIASVQKRMEVLIAALRKGNPDMDVDAILASARG